MATIYEIEGGVIRQIEKTVTYEASLDAVEQFISVPKPFVLPILPRGTVTGYMDPEGNRFDLLIERPPSDEVIKIELLGDPDYGEATGDYDDDDEEIVEYATRDEWMGYAQQLGYDHYKNLPEEITMPMPWQYFRFKGELANEHGNPSLSGWWLYWSPTKITSHDVELYVAQLPNINGHGSICFGEQFSTSGTLADKVNELIGDFYNFTFNQDYGHLTFPCKLPDLPNVTKDIFGCPEYDWSRMTPIHLNLAEIYDTAEPIQTVDTRFITGRTWPGMIAIEQWIATQTDSRKAALAVNAIRELNTSGDVAGLQGIQTFITDTLNGRGANV